MSIISNSQLSIELPDGYTTTQLTNAVNQASGLLNTWSIKYSDWPDYGDTPAAPDEVVRSCIEVAKALYFLSIGQVSRDGSETETWQGVLEYYKGYLEAVEIAPSVESVTISLTDGIHLIARNANILPVHPKCRVVSASTNVWNQGYHWTIRRGSDSESEHIDGWYFDAETYEDTIEGTLYYARSWRSDGLDYQKYWKK